MLTLIKQDVSHAQYNIVTFPWRRYGIVKGAPWVETGDPGMEHLLPSAQPMQDQPAGDSKGSTIPILDDWWNYIADTNDTAGYMYALSVGALWINIEYRTEIKTPRAESVMSAYNYIAWDEETNTHVKLLSYSWHRGSYGLVPEVDCWKHKPYMFWKCAAYNEIGDVFKVANGVDCYIPRIHNTELWMNKSYIEAFPVGPDYRFSGIEVFDGDQPLLVYNNGVRSFPTAWHIETKNVVP